MGRVFNQGWGLAIILMTIKVNQKKRMRIKCLPRHTINDEKNSIPSQAHEKKTKKSYFRTKVVLKNKKQKLRFLIPKVVPDYIF